MLGNAWAILPPLPSTHLFTGLLPVSASRQPLTLRNLLGVLRAAFAAWLNSDAFLHAAALAYYTIFSVVPLLVFFISLSTTVADNSDVQWRIVAGIQRQAGAGPATFVREVVVNSETYLSSRLATGFGVLVLIWGASSVFHQMQNSLNAMWHLVPRAGNIRQGLLYVLTLRLLSALIVILAGLLLVSLVVMNTLWTADVIDPIHDFVVAVSGRNPWLRAVITPAIYVFFFMLMFKFLPQAQVRWRDLLPGAVLITALIWAGNQVIGFYLSSIFLASIYGAGGSVVVFLLWIYYIAVILLFGAKFILVYCQRIGQPITPRSRVIHKL